MIASAENVHQFVFPPADMTGFPFAKVSLAHGAWIGWPKGERNVVGNLRIGEKGRR